MTRPETGVADPDGADGPQDIDRTAADARPDETPVTGPSSWRWQPIDAAVAAVFIALGYLVTSDWWKSPTSTSPTSNPNDPTFFEWMLVHAVRIFSHGENPFFTSQLNAPNGVNLMSNTSMLGLTVPFAPLTAWLGPSPVFVLIIMLCLAGTAFAWYYVMARHFVGNRFAAFVGGAFCGFGPGILTHANAHPNIVAQFVLPFILHRTLLLRTSTRPIRDGVIVGLLITYQAFINEEILFLTALAAVVFVLVYVAFRPRLLRQAGALLLGLCYSAGTAAILLAYPLWYQFKGPQHFSGLPQMLDSYPYWLPLDSFVTLPSLSPWGVPYGTTPDGFPTGTEQNSFLGWGLVVVVIAAVILLWRRRPAVRALAVVGVLFAWASLGGRISVTHTGHTYPLSLWRHLSNVPPFDSVLPSRMALVLVPVIGLLLAFAVADAYRAIAAASDGGKLAPAAVGGVAIAAIAVALVRVAPIPIPVAPRTPVPQFFTSGDWRPYVPAGMSVLPANSFEETDFMRWAIAADLDFSVPGGYFLGPAPLEKGQTTPVGQYGPQWRTSMVILGNIGDGNWSLPGDIRGYQQEMRQDLNYWKTAIIVLPVNQSHFTEEKDAVTRLTGLPGKQVDDVWMWDVRSLTTGG